MYSFVRSYFTNPDVSPVPSSEISAPPIPTAASIPDTAPVSDQTKFLATSDVKPVAEAESDFVDLEREKQAKIKAKADKIAFDRSQQEKLKLAEEQIKALNDKLLSASLIIDNLNGERQALVNQLALLKSDSAINPSAALQLENSRHIEKIAELHSALNEENLNMVGLVKALIDISEDHTKACNAQDVAREESAKLNDENEILRQDLEVAKEKLVQANLQIEQAIKAGRGKRKKAFQPKLENAVVEVKDSDNEKAVAPSAGSTPETFEELQKKLSSKITQFKAERAPSDKETPKRKVDAKFTTGPRLFSPARNRPEGAAPASVIKVTNRAPF